MKKYKVVEKKPINKHKHKLDKYTAYIDVLEKLLAKMDCNDEKIQKYNDLIVSLMQKKDKYKEKILCVNAIEMAYDISNDDRLFDVGELMNTTFNFFANNTSLSREEIKQKVNNNLVDVLIEEEFPDNPTGVGYYNSEFGEMALRADQIKSEEIKLLLRHELTHVLGTQVVKGIVASGYSRSYNEDSVKLLTIKQKETIFSKLQRKAATMFNKQKKNNQFNEACVEMFAHKDVPLQTKSTYSIWFFEKNLNTNFSTGSFYIYNANFVREMIIAAGISEDELFKGLFDYKSSEKVMKKFGSKTFKTISNNMEKLYSELTAYNTIIEGLFDKYYDSSMQEDDEIFKRCTTDEIKKKDEAIMKIEKRMASIEKNIIDKILLKRIKNLSAEERKRVVGGFSKFVICERDYFEKVTGFKYEQDVNDTEQTRISQYRFEAGNLSTEKAKNGEKSSFKNSDELEK